MKSLKIMAIVLFICAASTGIFATSPLPPPFSFLFFNFETHTEITEFTVTDYNLSATFSGGLVKDNLNTSENEDSHWVVLPAGTTTEGVSTGSAIITMSPPAARIATLTLAGADAQVRVQLLDDLDNVVEEHSFSNSEELDIFWVSVGGGPLVSKILVIIDGGTAETAMSRFIYWNADFFAENIDDEDNGSGGVAYSLLGIFFILLGMRHWRQKTNT